MNFSCDGAKIRVTPADGMPSASRHFSALQDSGGTVSAALTARVAADEGNALSAVLLEAARAPQIPLGEAALNQDQPRKELGMLRKH